MKKIFSLLAILIIATTAFSQTFNLQSTHFTYRVTGGDWTGWVPATVNASVNMDTKNIYVYSQDPQMFTFSNLTQEDFNGYSNFKGYAIDKIGNTVGLNITIYESGEVFIRITYSDGEYMYKFRFINNQGNSYM